MVSANQNEGKQATHDFPFDPLLCAPPEQQSSKELEHSLCACQGRACKDQPSLVVHSVGKPHILLPEHLGFPGKRRIELRRVYRVRHVIGLFLIFHCDILLEPL